MVRKSTAGAVMAAMFSLAAATPVQYLGTERMSAAQIHNLTVTTDRKMLEAFGCRGQSCTIADAAGSSGRRPTMIAQGGSTADFACIAAHNPDYKTFLAQSGISPSQGPAQDTGISTALMQGINALWRPLVSLTGSTETGTFDGTCSPNILIFAKGTFEPGTYGVFVGPSFTSGLPSGWSTAGVAYDPDVPGDFCLGLPGGMVAKDVINQANKKCPNSNLFLSGYSQGAMVIRNGLARANREAVAKVKGVVTFGDPFDGSPIKDYNGPISVFCNDGDGVCSGNFEIAASHLSYGMDTSASLGQAALLKMALGLGSSSSSPFSGLFGGLFG